MHRGNIWVESSGLSGHGTTFYFSLPTRAELTPEHDDFPPETSVILVNEKKGRGRRVREYLETRGYIVDELIVEDEDDWLDTIIRNSPGGVVLDIEPATDRGWELMRALKTHSLLHDVPVIFYSLLEEQEKGSVLTLDYLTKPVPPEYLIRALEEYQLSPDESKSCTVLVVDDTPSIIDLHSQIVRQCMPYCRILTANNGKEALAIMNQDHPDLVLLDLMMPEMDGFEVLQVMQDRQDLRSVPVIVMTAYDLLTSDIKRLKYGVHTILMKGMLSEEETLSLVEAALMKSKKLRSETQQLARKAMAYIHEHYAQPISREDIARYVSISDEYLSNCFRQEMGVTLVAYINRFRIKKAKELLQRGDKSITEVALDVGFSSQPYFSRMFRQQAGISPSAYLRGIHNTTKT
jgi:CheY-like chemotaxis protein